jgi:hypothetical protein
MNNKETTVYNMDLFLSPRELILAAAITGIFIIVMVAASNLLFNVDMPAIVSVGWVT